MHGRWWFTQKKKTIETEYVNERMITTTIKWHQLRSKFSSENFLQLRVRGRARQKIYKQHRDSLQKKHTTIIAGEFNSQRGLGMNSECDHVGTRTTGEPNKRGIWMKQWLVIQNCVALNATVTKTMHRSTSGKEKRLDYVLIDKKNRNIFHRRRSKRHNSRGKRPQICFCAFSIPMR